MKDKLKTIIKGAEKELAQYASEIDGGKTMTEKDPERLSKLLKIVRDGKIICFLTELTEQGGQSQGGGMGQLLGGLTKSMGGGMMPSMTMGFESDLNDSYNSYNRQGGGRGGNQGGRGGNMNTYNNYDTYDSYDMNNRHRGKDGRWVRNEYDSPDNRQGVPGSHYPPMSPEDHEEEGNKKSLFDRNK